MPTDTHDLLSSKLLEHAAQQLRINRAGTPLEQFCRDFYVTPTQWREIITELSHYEAEIMADDDLRPSYLLLREVVDYISERQFASLFVPEHARTNAPGFGHSADDLGEINFRVYPPMNRFFLDIPVVADKLTTFLYNKLDTKNVEHMRATALLAVCIARAKSQVEVLDVRDPGYVERSAEFLIGNGGPRQLFVDIIQGIVDDRERLDHLMTILECNYQVLIGMREFFYEDEMYFEDSLDVFAELYEATSACMEYTFQQILGDIALVLDPNTDLDEQGRAVLVLNRVYDIIEDVNPDAFTQEQIRQLMESGSLNRLYSLGSMMEILGSEEFDFINSNAGVENGFENNLITVCSTLHDLHTALYPGTHDRGLTAAAAYRSHVAQRPMCSFQFLADHIHMTALNVDELLPNLLLIDTFLTYAKNNLDEYQVELGLKPDAMMRVTLDIQDHLREFAQSSIDVILFELHNKLICDGTHGVQTWTDSLKSRFKVSADQNTINTEYVEVADDVYRTEFEMDVLEALVSSGVIDRMYGMKPHDAQTLVFQQQIEKFFTRLTNNAYFTSSLNELLRIEKEILEYCPETPLSEEMQYLKDNIADIVKHGYLYCSDVEMRNAQLENREVLYGDFPYQRDPEPPQFWY